MLDEEESFIDATFAMAKGGGAEIGPTKRGKGMKIMAIVDRHGLPLSVSTHAANHHEVRLVQLCFDFYMIEAKPETLIGDRAYDSDPLDNDLRKDGIEMVAPHRSNRRKCATQDGRRLRRYARRWLVERFFAWIQWQRRILVRWEFYPKNFLGSQNFAESEPSAPPKPCECSFHDPSFWQDDKAFSVIRAFDDFDIHLRHYLRHSAAKHRALIAAISVEF